jgi:hypothetical protein
MIDKARERNDDTPARSSDTLASGIYAGEDSGTSGVMLMVVLRFCNASWATGILVYITQQDSKILCFEDKTHKNVVMSRSLLGTVRL